MGPISIAPEGLLESQHEALEAQHRGGQLTGGFVLFLPRTGASHALEVTLGISAGALQYVNCRKYGIHVH